MKANKVKTKKRDIRMTDKDWLKNLKENLIVNPEDLKKPLAVSINEPEDDYYEAYKIYEVDSEPRTSRFQKYKAALAGKNRVVKEEVILDDGTVLPDEPDYGRISTISNGLYPVKDEEDLRKKVPWGQDYKLAWYDWEWLYPDTTCVFCTNTCRKGKKGDPFPTTLLTEKWNPEAIDFRNTAFYQPKVGWTCCNSEEEPTEDHENRFKKYEDKIVECGKKILQENGD